MANTQDIVTMLNIPVAFEGRGLLSALNRPNYLVYLSSWGLTRWSPTGTSKSIGYNINGWISAFLLFTITSWVQATEHSYIDRCKKNSCIVVVDAGSTGSRALLYSYPGLRLNTPDNIELLAETKVSGGIAQLEPLASNFAPYLEQLLGGYRTANPLPVFFYATAGMRLIPHHQQTLRFQQISNWFKEHPRYILKENTILTGEQEAIYDWLSVNYQVGTFSNDTPGVGVMDMGGASVQIAFPVKPGFNKPHQHMVEMYGKKYYLYAKSFLGLGLGQDKVIGQFLNFPECFPKNYQLPNQLPGTGSIFACTSAVNHLVNGVHKVNTHIATLVQEHPQINWYTLGGINFLVNNPPLQVGLYYSIAELLMASDQRACSYSWESLASQYPDNRYLYRVCFNSAYYTSLIHYGYGLPSDRVITGVKSGWTYGVVLMEGNQGRNE